MIPRISSKDRANIIAAIRRAFVRSKLRASIIESLPAIDHFDEKRPRVKHWRLCPICKILCPRYMFEVDHIVPVVPIGVCTVDMDWDELINRIFGDPNNMQAICKDCHKKKTSCERKERYQFKHK